MTVRNDETGGLDFGEAIRALKRGLRVARKGWNGKGMWVAMSGILGGRLVKAGDFWCPHNSRHAEQNGGGAVVMPCLTMRAADGSIVMGWLASQTDMLAEDWEVLA